MRRTKYLLLSLITFMIATTMVGASTCGYEESAKLNNQVGNVKVTYEITQEIEEGAPPPDALLGTEYEEDYVSYIDVTNLRIMNLTEDLVAVITNDYNKDIVTVNYSDTDNGNYLLPTPAFRKIVKFKVELKASDKTSCRDEKLRTINQTLPRYNEYSRYSMCSTVPEYYMCQKYVTFPDNISFGKFSESVMQEVEKKIQEEEEKSKPWYKKIGDFVVEHKTAFMIGGIAVVVAGGATAAVIIIKRRRDEI